MMLFLHEWMLTAAALSVTICGLVIAYRLLGSDLGADGPIREAVIVLCTSAAQAGAALLVQQILTDASPRLDWVIAVVAAIISYMAYRVSHFDDMDDMEAGAIALGNAAVLLFVRLSF